MCTTYFRRPWPLTGTHYLRQILALGMSSRRDESGRLTLVGFLVAPVGPAISLIGVPVMPIGLAVMPIGLAVTPVPVPVTPVGLKVPFSHRAALVGGVVTEVRRPRARIVGLAASRRGVVA
jgi:hypothetical protein